MKPIKLTPNITVTATILKNAINLSIRIRGRGPTDEIHNTQLRHVVRDFINNPENGFEPNKFIATVHNTPKRAKINVTLLSTTEITEEKIKITAMNIMEEL